MKQLGGEYVKYLNVWKQLASPLSLGQRDGAEGRFD